MFPCFLLSKLLQNFLISPRGAKKFFLKLLQEIFLPPTPFENTPFKSHPTPEKLKAQGFWRCVRVLSVGLKFAPFSRFSSVVGICSGCCPFVRLWGFCAFVLGVLSFPVAVFPSVAVGFWAWLWCTSSTAFPGFLIIKMLFVWSVCLFAVWFPSFSVVSFRFCCGGIL